ncbi:rme1-like gtpase atpase without a c-terminal eh domain protein [Nannochloropsis gaditana]|uniref:Rme1-like gtpase atpase without a c-terminal eh domain protein n=1 Tax=Nannochloropsis gaditana TaxID=72520 RepID=W7TJF7_9STRA|nr:rme1-like gtpase atpase without a c-terminal eh domain protein [Nannochloropsis gaditana]
MYFKVFLLFVESSSCTYGVETHNVTVLKKMLVHCHLAGRQRLLLRSGSPKPSLLTLLRFVRRLPLERSLSTDDGNTTHSGTIKLDSQRRVLQRCDELQSYLQPINDRLRGPLEKCSDKAPLLPFVFLLGNHSSGKSSFVNYVCNRPIQTAGVAPTDDSFTIIAPGPTDIDQDGPSTIGDPDMGFAGLRHFGPDLIHHTQLKIRAGLATTEFMLVDSPGMIDSPHASASQPSPSSLISASDKGDNTRSARNHLDRGYDFQGVCRWFADRADVILLFFDPDKPGTTGETLSILTQSLAGMDHKLYIVLNKADQFRKIHDFARAYGSLCWNLSKVIPRKDLPRIYTMCLPAAYQRQQTSRSSRPAALGIESEIEGPSSGLGLADLERSREEVVGEVLKAPKRRIDNVITRLADSVHLVQMHALVLEALRNDFARELWRFRAGAASLCLAGMGAVGGGMYLGVAFQTILAFSVLYALGAGGFVYANEKMLKEHAAVLASPEGLRLIFERLYARPVMEGDEFVNSLWKRTFPSLQIMLNTQVGRDLGKLPKVSKAELQEIQCILEEEVPALRRLAAPVSWTFSKYTKDRDGMPERGGKFGEIGQVRPYCHGRQGRNHASTHENYHSWGRACFLP